MRVKVKATWNRGAPLSERKLERTPAIRGELTVSIWSWGDAPPKLTARLTDSSATPLLPPLHDVVLSRVDQWRIVLRGIETLKTSRGEVQVVQEWHVGARLD